uniref:Uncharacterized protein n=1 Tax=viral metagenome TaxID=1070528 RepID=A0A6C0CAE8_9ZZZZ
MRTRSHRYSREDGEYTNSTHYDPQNNSLDIGFQRLKIFNCKIYPDMSSIKFLFVHQNNITNLPDASLLPNLTELNCSNNNLKNIPFYRKLITLNISFNKVTELNHYHNSDLKYLDCSFNPNIALNIYLPYCKHLYINDTKLTNIKLSRFRKLKFLDCSNNNLHDIDPSNSLLELNIQNNEMTELPLFPILNVLMIDDNFLTSLVTYPYLKILNASRNKLIHIDSQPQLTKITASHNLVSKIGLMPKLEIIELDNNNITNFEIFGVSKHVCLQFNPITNLGVHEQAFQNIEELQVDYKMYEKIYAKCYDSIKSINIFACENKIDEKIKKLEGVFSARMLKFIKKMFLKTEFQNRGNMFGQITVRICDEYFKNDDETTMREKCIMTLKNISKLYHKIIVVSLIFNY